MLKRITIKMGGDNSNSHQTTDFNNNTLLEHVLLPVRYPFEFLLFEYLGGAPNERLGVEDLFDFAVAALTQQVAHHVLADHLARFLLGTVHHRVRVERVEESARRRPAPIAVDVVDRPVGRHVQHQVFEHVLVVVDEFSHHGGARRRDILVGFAPLRHRRYAIPVRCFRRPRNTVRRRRRRVKRERAVRFSLFSPLTDGGGRSGKNSNAAGPVRCVGTTAVRAKMAAAQKRFLDDIERRGEHVRCVVPARRRTSTIVEQTSQNSSLLVLSHDCRCYGTTPTDRGVRTVDRGPC